MNMPGFKLIVLVVLAFFHAVGWWHLTVINRRVARKNSQPNDGVAAALDVIIIILTNVSGYFILKINV